MATPKKPTKKPAKKPTSGATPRARAGRAASREAAPLTPEERRALTKAPDDAAELVRRAVDAWNTHRRVLKVPSRSAAQLARLQRATDRATDREAAAQRALVVAQDARLRAEHASWSAMLDLYAVVKASARTAPELQAAFAFLSQHFARGKKS